MKTSIFLLFLGFGSVVFVPDAYCQDTITNAMISFVEEVHDYGTIKYDSNGICEFLFSNTGNAPLVITSVKGSCGCMVPEWSREPIAPGAVSRIKVKYDTKRVGPIIKSLTVRSNDTFRPVIVLRIKGTVLPEPEPVFPPTDSGPVRN